MAVVQVECNPGCRLSTTLNTKRPEQYRCRVPEECPQAVADLVAQCMDADPTARPSAKEVVSLLSQPDAVLERHLPSRRPRAADAQVHDSAGDLHVTLASILPC